METYVRGVLSGDILACEFVIAACQRHVDDIKASRSKEHAFRFSWQHAARKIKFIHLLPHVKGKWARKIIGKPGAHLVRLAPWQLFIVGSIFGWVKKADGLRRFLKASIYVPRKNGKSLLAAAIGLAMFCVDDEIGAEIYSGATTEKQALEVFAPARRMCLNTPALVQHYGVEVNAATLFKPEDGGKFEPIIGKPGDGSSPHCAIIDEYHEHATSAQYDAMDQGMGARDQPLLLVISTAGSDIAGPCYEDWQVCERILRRQQDSPRHFAIIFTYDKDDDWTSELALRKANPNMDVSVSRESLELAIRDGINRASKQGAVKTKRLNRWIQARDAYFNMEHWNTRCLRPGLNLLDYLGADAYLGLDLASKVDLAALNLTIPLDKGYAVFGKYYLPEATVELPENQHYRTWRDEGWLTVTEGNMIDFSVIQDDILELAGMFSLQEIAYDPTQATMLVTSLQDEGLTMVEVRPLVLNFSEPMKTMDGLMREGAYHHNGDPVMAWAISNTVAKTDAKDNVYPRKDHAAKKIDPVVAHLMALARALRREGGGDSDGFFSAPVRA
jgi:phage terminase large subunit-like protein